MRKLLAAIALVLVAGACTVPAPAATPVWSKVCVPTESVRSTIGVVPYYVPESAWVDWNYWWWYEGQVFDDSGVTEGTTTDLVAGELSVLATIDAGRCLHMKPSPNLGYSIVIAPFPNYTAPTLGWFPSDPLPTG